MLWPGMLSTTCIDRASAPAAGISSCAGARPSPAAATAIVADQSTPVVRNEQTRAFRKLCIDCFLAMPKYYDDVAKNPISAGRPPCNIMMTALSQHWTAFGSSATIRTQ